NSTLEDKIKSLPQQPKVGFQQFSGHVTLDTHHRSLFYYFVEAEVDPASKPVVLWLNGGPGCSSVGQGAFSEHGPFRPTTKGLIKNAFSWNKGSIKFLAPPLIYLDTPIGVDFSYSANKSDYAFVNDQITGITCCFYKAGSPDSPLIKTATSSSPERATQMGNPLLEFDKDFSSGAEFLWSHGQISESTYQMLKNICSFAEIKRQIRGGNLSTGCQETSQILSTKISGYTDRFDVIADTCQPQQSQQAYVLTKLQAEEKIDVVTAYDFQNLENPTISMLGKLVKSGVRVLSYSGDQDSVIPFTGTRSLVAGLAKELALNTTESHRA
ncbi:serine carboxypeptidase-like protein, partial [Medicago truncatula]